MNEHLKPDEIEMKERAEKATKGPWRAHDHNTMHDRFGDNPKEWVGYAWVGCDGQGDPPNSYLFNAKIADLDSRNDASPAWRRIAAPNAHFIAAARTDLPTILARLANERAKLAAVQDALKFYADKKNYIADAQDEPSRADYERGDRARSALRRINELEKQP